MQYLYNLGVDKLFVPLPTVWSVDPLSIFFMISSIILLGFAASVLFKKTGLPDILFLILLGMLFGPVLHILEESVIKAITGLVGGVAIAIILFDSGLGLNLNKVLKESPKGVAMSILWFLASLVSIGFLSHYLLKIDLMIGFYLGAALGGVSAPVVLGLLREDIINEDIRIRAIVESVLSDVLCIVVAISILDSLEIGYIDPSVFANMLLNKFSAGLVVGGFTGVLWLFILSRLYNVLGKGEIEYSYIASIGLVLLVYALTEYAGASGGIAALSFGLALSNRWVYQPLVDFSRYEMLFENTTTYLKRFSDEISFFMKSLFFAYFGMMYMFTDYLSLIVGLIIVAVVFAERYLLAYILTRDRREYIPLMGSLIGKGLAAAVLVQLPLIRGIQDSVTLFSIGVNVVLFSLIATTIAGFVLQKKYMKLKEEEEKERKKEEEEEGEEK